MKTTAHILLLLTCLAYMHSAYCDSLPLQQAPTLETKRLILRAPSLEDTQALFLITSDPEITKYTAMFKNHATPAETHDYITDSLARTFKGDDCLWLIIDKESNRVIGIIDIFEYSAAHARVELGYTISRDARGKGFATEAALCVIEFCFNSLNINRVQAGVDPENISSIRVLEKCGMQFEGLLHGYRILRGKSVNRNMYAILKDASQETA